MFDDEFTTLNYLNSTDSPPSWRNLCQNSCEKITDEQYNLTRTWYEGEKATHEKPDKESIPTYGESEEMRETSTENEKPKVFFATPTVSNNSKEYKEIREPPVPRSSLSDKMRETTSHQDSSNLKPSKSKPFADIASIGLRRGKIIKAPSQMLSHHSDIKKRVRKKEYGHC